MNFRTRLDFTNRQAKQYERTDINLSGTTTFGLPYSALTTGPNLLLTGITYQNSVLQSTYSGNTGTTVYTFGDSRMTIDEGELSALTPSNSGTTQYAGPTWSGYNMFTTVDGYTGWTSYSAVTYDLDVITMVDLGSGSYSGIVQSDFIVYSGESLDYTGSTIWVDVSGITRTDELIVTKNSEIGYVLTCADIDGRANWLPVSAATSGVTSTIWTAGTGTNSVVQGGSNGSGSGISSISEGFQSTASGDYSHAEGLVTIASGLASHAEGQQTTASGDYSHSEGSGTTAFGLYSHAEGYGTTTRSNAPYSHAEGYLTYAKGDASHTEGYNTISDSTGSHAEGHTTIATGSTSHAEGFNTMAIGSQTHAEGSYTIASGQSSHAQGFGTVSSGDYSHSEGSNTTASGIHSHAQGSITTASGIASFSSGSGCTASGDFSFVHSYNSTVSGARSVVLGGQNITALSADTVYVPDLVIDGLTSTDPIATDSTGRIVAGVSDARLKENIEPLSSALNKVKELRGVSFNYTDASNMGSGLRYGFIAQEVQPVIPEMVRFRSKGDGMLNLNYSEIIPWLVEAVKELASGSTSTNNLIIDTQTIASEDNNIELNYNGNHDSSLYGGITVLNGVSDGIHSEIKIDENGRWIITPSLATPQISLPEYTPKSTDDKIGGIGDVVWDNNYVYIKRNNGWGRCKLENF